MAVDLYSTALIALVVVLTGILSIRLGFVRYLGRRHNFEAFGGELAPVEFLGTFTG